MVVESYRRRLAGLFATALRRGEVVVGYEATQAVVEAGPPPLLLVATDASDRVRRFAERTSDVCPAIHYGRKTELGEMCRRLTVGVTAITHAGIADEIADTAARATALTEAE